MFWHKKLQILKLGQDCIILPLPDVTVIMMGWVLWSVLVVGHETQLPGCVLEKGQRIINSIVLQLISRPVVVQNVSSHR